MKIVALILAPLALALLIAAGKVLHNRAVLRRLERSGYRRVALRRAYRGHAVPEVLLMLMQFFFILLLLVAVFGWLGVQERRW
jgi:hypothetical protein